jgi:hypothetical protein
MHSGYSTIFTEFIPRNSNGEIWGMYHGFGQDNDDVYWYGSFYVGAFLLTGLPLPNYVLTLLFSYGLGIPIGYIYFDTGWVWSFLHTLALTWMNQGVARHVVPYTKAAVMPGSCQFTATYLPLPSGTLADECAIKSWANGIYKLPDAEYHMHALL